eukprot:1728915-Pyramimonas_sp.AAC.1
MTPSQPSRDPLATPRSVISLPPAQVFQVVSQRAKHAAYILEQRERALGTNWKIVSTYEPKIMLTNSPA